MSKGITLITVVDGFLGLVLYFGLHKCIIMVPIALMHFRERFFGPIYVLGFDIPDRIGRFELCRSIVKADMFDFLLDWSSLACSG